MLMTIIRKELLHNMLSLRYLASFVLFVGLTFGATAIRTTIYQKHLVNHQSAVRERLRLMEAVKDNNQASGLGITVEKPPSPLAIFVSGLENEMTRSFSLSDWRPPSTGLRKLNIPSFQYFPSFDIMLVINLVCSLLAMFLVFDSVCGEREAGTLKVLLGGPVPRDTIILGKLGAGAVTLLVPLAAAWIASITYAVVVGKVALTADEMARLGWIVALSVAYIAFFFSLGMAATCWARQSATSLAVCLFCWIMFVLAVPNLIPMAVEHLAPIPPQTKIVREKQAIHEAIGKELEPKWREEMGASGKYDDPIDMTIDIMDMHGREFDRREAQVDMFNNACIERQLRMNQQLSRLSPSASYVYASTHLAGTGVQDFTSLLSDVDRFKREYGEAKTTQEHAARKASRERAKNGVSEESAPEVYDPHLYPKFVVRRIPLNRAVNASLVDILLITGGAVVLFMFAFVGFLRYDPR